MTNFTGALMIAECGQGRRPCACQSWRRVAMMMVVVVVIAMVVMVVAVVTVKVIEKKRTEKLNSVYEVHIGSQSFNVNLEMKLKVNHLNKDVK